MAKLKAGVRGSVSDSDVSEPIDRQKEHVDRISVSCSLLYKESKMNSTLSSWLGDWKVLSMKLDMERKSDTEKRYAPRTANEPMSIMSSKRIDKG